MASLVSKSYSKKLLRLISWGHWFTFFNICAAILLSSIYLFADPMPETSFGIMYLITNWFSHMAFLTFVTFVLIVFPITVLLPHTRFIRGFASFVFTFLLVLLVLDGFTYNALGYHLNASSSDQIITLIRNTIQKDSTGFWGTTISVTAIILIFELVVSNYAWKHIHQLQKTIFAKYSMIVLVATFVISHISHIWADANLEYDVLQQDSLLPLSYPSTAKTLLTKYGLFDKDTYIESRISPLSFNNNDIPNYPVLDACPTTTVINNSTFIVLNKNALTSDKIKQFSQRSLENSVRLGNHVNNANIKDSWFNLLYGLPNIYQENILKQNIAPLSVQRLQQLSLTHNLTVISENTNQDALPTWLNSIFNTTKIANASELIFGEHFNQLTPGLHIYYFDNDDNYQMSLFVDALLLAQQKLKQKDIIWVSQLGNEKETTQFADKPALLIWPNQTSKKIRVLTSHMDLQATLMKSWLTCHTQVSNYTTGDDILSLTENRIIANTNEHGMVIFDKDKSVFVDQLGNFQGYSRRLNAPILIKSDYPLMINGVHYIKKFSE